MDWGQNRILSVGENSGLILSRFWFKVHEILGQCRGPRVRFNVLSDFLYNVFFGRYSPLSLEVLEKPNKCKRFLAPNFWEGRPRLFYSSLLVRFTVHAPFGKVWLSFV